MVEKEKKKKERKNKNETKESKRVKARNDEPNKPRTNEKVALVCFLYSMKFFLLSYFEIIILATAEKNSSGQLTVKKTENMLHWSFVS